MLVQLRLERNRVFGEEEAVYVEPERHGGADLALSRSGKARLRVVVRAGAAPGAFAPFAYDATRMLLEAVDQVGTDRDAVRAYLAGIDSADEAYPGLTGPVYFDDTGDLAIHFISALVVRNGEFEPFSE